MPLVPADAYRAPAAKDEPIAPLEVALAYLDEFLDRHDGDSLKNVPRLDAGLCEQCGTHARSRYSYGDYSLELCRSCAHRRATAFTRRKAAS